jgi:DNA-binding transcriptional regulator YhcF (GntR family)
MSLRKRERERAERAALERVRGRIVTGIHAGHLNTGDRLPSYRELSHETGLDLRAAARIYAALEKEGLVEIRGKTGVYVSSQERIGGRVLAETARWTVGVLTEAWRRHIPMQDYPAFVERCIATLRVRCACIESTEDQLTSLCRELADDFGVSSSPIHGDQLLGFTLDGVTEATRMTLAQANMIVTTTFQAANVRPLAIALEKPLVVMKLDQDLTQAIERHLADKDLIVVCVDPRFIERMRAVFEQPGGGRIHGILVSNKPALARINTEEPIVVTAAARSQLKKSQSFRSLLPANYRIFSPQSAQDVIETVIRLNLEAMRQHS